MWPSLNQLLCAALPKEVTMWKEDGLTCCFSMLGVQTKHLSRKKKKKFCLIFLSERKPHSLQCILDLHDLTPSPVTCTPHSLTLQTRLFLNWNEPTASRHPPCPLFLTAHLSEAYPSFTMQSTDTSTRKVSQPLHAALSHISSCLRQSD